LFPLRGFLVDDQFDSDDIFAPVGIRAQGPFGFLAQLAHGAFCQRDCVFGLSRRQSGPRPIRALCTGVLTRGNQNQGDARGQGTDAVVSLGHATFLDCDPARN